MQKNSNLDGKKFSDQKDFGEYLIDGNKVSIDYNADTVSAELMEKLLSAKATQYDIFTIRQSWHRLLTKLNSLFANLEIEYESLSKDFKELQEGIPIMAEKAVHDVVNGKFTKLETMFTEIKDGIGNIDKQISYTFGKTIFGWMKRNFEKHPLRSLLLFTLFVIINFLVILQIFHYPVAIEIWKFFKSLIPGIE